MNKRGVTTQRFRQSVPAIGLSLERCTEHVPADGYFYVLLSHEVKGKFRRHKQALVLYRRILDESGWQPEPPRPPPKSSTETVERYLDDLEEYWNSSHRHTRRGGKGRH